MNESGRSVLVVPSGVAGWGWRAVKSFSATMLVYDALLRFE
jgi:hypothetical protein